MGYEDVRMSTTIVMVHYCMLPEVKIIWYTPTPWSHGHGWKTMHKSMTCPCSIAPSHFSTCEWMSFACVRKLILLQSTFFLGRREKISSFFPSFPLSNTQEENVTKLEKWIVQTTINVQNVLDRGFS
jgi:hypothetical protein